MQEQSGQEMTARHFGIAEYGKLAALRGDHTTALMCYRDAMSMAVAQGAPEVVFRHYLECSLESLEHMGAWPELLEYCDRAVEHYRRHPPGHELARHDLASIHQRRGLALLKSGDSEAAIPEFERALAVVRRDGRVMHLAAVLLRWLKAQMHLSPERVVQEQIRTNYFSVREETVVATRAIAPENGAAGAARLVV